MRGILLSSAAGALIVSSTALASIEVILSDIPGHPTAVVPLGPALATSAEFVSFDRPFTSPNGQWWILQAQTNLAATEDRVIVVFDGSTWSTVIREGLQAPWTLAAETVGVMDANMGINNAGLFAFNINTTGGGTTDDEYTVKFDGADYVVVAQEGQPAVGGGDWGATQGSADVLSDGSAFFDSTVSIGGSRIVQGAGVVAQSTVTVLSNQPNATTETFSSLSNNFAHSSADGVNSIFRCNLNGDTTVDEVIAVNNRVVLHEGMTIPGMASQIGTSYVQTSMSHNGNWMVRGATTDADADYVVRNGTLVAKGLDPITPGNPEHFDDVTFAALFFSQYENGNGDYIVGGVTDAADVLANAVLVLNGTTVVARENDMVDLNGNGLADDDAFIAVFNNDDLFLTDDLQLYFTADLRNGKATVIGQALLHIDLAPATDCPTDIASVAGVGVLDGVVDVSDLLAVITNWGAVGPNPADIAGLLGPGPDGVVDVSDLLAVITSWGDCPR